MNRWTLLPAAAGLASCVGSDPLDSDDPSPVAPELSVDDHDIGSVPTDGEDGVSGPDTGGAQQCTLEIPETLMAESLGDDSAEIIHKGVDLPSCGWTVRTTVDTSARQIAISYVADGGGADCSELCDTDVAFTARGLTSGSWTVLAGLSETILEMP